MLSIKNSNIPLGQDMAPGIFPDFNSSDLSLKSININSLLPTKSMALFGLIDWIEEFASLSISFKVFCPIDHSFSSDIASVLYISRRTGFSINFPSTITRPVLASSKILVIFLALAIFSSEGVKTLFKSFTCFG